jgi:hypothetical protein
MDQPYLNVRISIEAAIAPDGHVTDVNLAADRDGTARLQSCIHDAVQSWTFPRPAGDAPGRITNTLRFD